MPRYAVIAAVALFLVATAVDFARRREAQSWERRVQSVEAHAAAMRARADSATAAADTAESRARFLANLADVRGRMSRERVEVVRVVAVPDTCAPHVLPRDSIIDALIEENDLRGLAYAEQVRVSDALRAAGAALRVSNDSLVAVLGARPKPRPAWLPQAGVGTFAGMCAGGPCYGAGVTLSWRFPL